MVLSGRRDGRRTNRQPEAFEDRSRGFRRVDLRDDGRLQRPFLQPDPASLTARGPESGPLRGK
jgi:hypothetical protein